MHYVVIQQRKPNGKIVNLFSGKWFAANVARKMVRNLQAAGADVWQTAV